MSKKRFQNNSLPSLPNFTHSSLLRKASAGQGLTIFDLRSYKTKEIGIEISIAIGIVFLHEDATRGKPEIQCARRPYPVSRARADNGKTGLCLPVRGGWCA